MFGRRYPESGPERREREEWQDRVYGAGEHIIKKCLKCDQPFSENDKNTGNNKVHRQVFHSSPDSGIPVRTKDFGGICDICQLKEKVSELEKEQAEQRRSEEIKRTAKPAVPTCRLCGSKYGDDGYCDHRRRDYQQLRHRVM